MKKGLVAVILMVVITAVAALIYDSQKDVAAHPFSLVDLDGANVTEANLQGKVTLINFWYPSCPGCVVEMPKLIDTQKKFAKTDFQTFAISMNYNTEAEVRNYVEQYNLPFTVMYDKDNAVSTKYGVTLAPNTFIIDKKGNIVKAYLGEPKWEDLHELIAQELAKK